MLTSLIGFTVVAALLTVSPAPTSRWSCGPRSARVAGPRCAPRSASPPAASCGVGRGGGVDRDARRLEGGVRRAADRRCAVSGVARVQALRSARARRGTGRDRAGTGRGSGGRTGDGRAPAVPGGSWRAFRGGLLTNVLNPKVGVVYLSLLPQFIPHGAPVVATTMLLVTVHAVLGVLWLGG
ncbi:LysE family translocator [Streptomyces albulus]|nr:LysE family translocator [Streptomyces noursei]